MNRFNDMRRPFCLTIVAALFMVSCVDLSSNSNEEECRDRIAEPIFIIEGAVNSVSFEKIETVRIENVTINNNPISADSLMNDFPQNLTLENGILTCKTPCGFGTSPGVFKMNITRPGFESLSLSAEADYLVKRSGCLSLRTGGYRISLQMKPG